MVQQTRLGSFIEATINVIIGYCVAILSQITIFPFFGINITWSDNLWIGFWFTVVSLIRQYMLRRYFNARIHRKAMEIAYGRED